MLDLVIQRAAQTKPRNLGGWGPSRKNPGAGKICLGGKSSLMMTRMSLMMLHTVLIKTTSVAKDERQLLAWRRLAALKPLGSELMRIWTSFFKKPCRDPYESCNQEFPGVMLSSETSETLQATQRYAKLRQAAPRHSQVAPSSSKQLKAAQGISKYLQAAARDPSIPQRCWGGVWMRARGLNSWA